MKSRPRHLLTIALSVLLASIAGCSGFKELASELGEINKLQQQLQQQTGQSSLNVNLTNDRFLSVSFVNSPLAKLPADQKKAKALETAHFAYNDWPKRANLASVTVIFLSSYDVGPVHYTNSTDNFEFQVSDLVDKSPVPAGKPPASAH